MHLEIAFGILAIVSLCVATYQLAKHKEYKKRTNDFRAEAIIASASLAKEQEKYRKLLSQKKSSETRLGQISENLVPFLVGCPHNPKNMTFLGQPIDYLVFDLDEGKITFLEVKSGNSRASKKQRLIKNIIQEGHVYYEEIRINEKGVKTKKAKNVE